MRSLDHIGHIDAERLPTATPLEIDTVLAAAYNLEYELRGYLAAVRRRLSKPGGYTRDADLAAAERYEAELAELDAYTAAYRAEYERRPWNRYYLVLASNGHVHRGMHCSTCFPTTRYMWIVDLADCDEAEMIVEYGERACTVCFPDAPTHPAFDGPGRRDAEERAQRELEKRQRAAIKEAKTLQGDLVFTNLGDWKVETVAAAKAALREVVECRVVAGTPADHGWFSRRLERADEVEAAARRALTVKGVDAAEIDKIMERAAKRARTTWGL